MLNETGLTILNSFLFQEYDLPLCLEYDIILSHEQTKKKITIDALIGIGATSCVYSADMDGTKVAVKFTKNHKLERNIYLKLDDLNISTSWIGYFRHGIVTKLGTPVVSTIGPMELNNLKLLHFSKILDYLNSLHEKGYVHRDIRLTNILFIDGEVKLTDLGTVVAVNTPAVYLGAIETASQRILDHLKSSKRKEPIVFRKEDDFESLLKTFLIWKYGKSPTSSKYSELYNFWEDELDLFFYWTSGYQNWDVQEWTTWLHLLFNSQKRRN